MIARAEAYYDSRTDNKTPDQIRDLVSLGPPTDDPLPPGAWPYGAAASRGVPGLLVNPNRYPCHRTDQSLQYKVALMQFDCTTSLTDTTSPWKQQKDLVIRYFYHIYNLVPVECINQHIHVGSVHAKLEEKYSNYKNWLACLLIHQVAYGFAITRQSQDRLSSKGKLAPNKLIHNMFVRPMVFYLLTEMNPYNELKYELIMTSHCGKQQEHLIRTAKNHGIWSNTVVEPRVQIPADHQHALTAEHKDMCKGIPYEFARLCALLINRFDYGEDYKCSWTEEERQNLFEPLDSTYCIPRFPPIANRGKTYGRYAR